MVLPSIRVSQRYLPYLSGSLKNFARIPATTIYPLYTSLFTSITGTNGKQDPTVMAGVITIGVVMLLAMLLATPVFIRKYVVWHKQVIYCMKEY